MAPRDTWSFSVYRAFGLGGALHVGQVVSGVDRCTHVVVLWAGLYGPFLGETDLLG